MENGTVADVRTLARDDWGTIFMPSTPVTYSLLHVLPESVATFSTLLNRGLAKIRRRIGSRAKWTTAHVRAAIVQRQADLHVIVKDGRPAGFFVLTMQADPFLHVPTTLFVWLAYSDSPGDLYGLKLGLERIVAIAKDFGLDRVEFLSPRPGWRRLAESLGFKAVETIYSMELGD